MDHRLLARREGSETPSAPGRSMVGGSRLNQKICRGPIFHFKRQKAIVATALRCARFSSRCQLKSLRDEGWRRPLNHRKFGVDGPARAATTIERKGLRDGTPRSRVQNSV